MASKRTLPPGPARHVPLGNMREFYRDQLGFVTRCAREFGDVVYLKFLHVPVYLLSNPTDIEAVFTSHHFKKPRSLRLPLQKRVFGAGLLSAQGESWLRQRRCTEGAFRHHRLPRYAAEMSDCIDRMLSQWRPGETRDIYQEMKMLSLEIAVRTLFNLNTAQDVKTVREVCDTVAEVLAAQTGPFRLLLDNVLPTPNHIRFRKAITKLDRLAYDLINKARSSDANGRVDLLSLLVNAKDDEGRNLSPRQLRDELATLLFASHEAAGLAMTWSGYLLAGRPDIQSKLAAEAPFNQAQPRVLGLPYSRKVVLEALRLYPPNRSVAREALKDSEIGGYYVPTGAQILMSQWVVHRDARYFDRPADFAPERWTSEFIRSLPKFAFFPFGGGARICIGQEFAIMEAALLITALVQRFRLELVDGQEIQPRPSVLLRPSAGVQIRLAARQS